MPQSARWGVKRLLAIVRELSRDNDDLDAMLGRAIEAFVEVLHARVGSVFLMEKDASGEDMLVMRAGTRHMLQGRDVKTYKSGEGLTWAITEQEIDVPLVFRTAEARQRHPAYRAKYRSEPPELHVRNAFLGMCIRDSDHILGIWKAEDLTPTLDHPEAYFTEDDLQLARLLNSLFAYIIINHRLPSNVSPNRHLLARRCAVVAAAKTEDDAIERFVNAIGDAGWPNVMYSAFVPERQEIVGRLTKGEAWQRVQELTVRNFRGNDILAVALRENQATFVPDSAKDARCDPEAVVLAGMKAQYVLPIRLPGDSPDGIFGTLQIDMGDKGSLPDSECIALQAFAQYLAITLRYLREPRRVDNLDDAEPAALAAEIRVLTSALETHVEHCARRGIESEIASVRGALDCRVTELDQATAWSDALRRCREVVDLQETALLAASLEPLRDVIKRFHRRLAHHPLFEDIDWEISASGLRFRAEPGPHLPNQWRSSPLLVQYVMNEAQQNIVALAAFLAASITRGGKLRLAVLDDPVQAMDEINIFGFLDLLRALALTRRLQIVVTTGRADLFALARTKLRCLNEGNPPLFTAYRFVLNDPEAGTQIERVT